MFEDLGGPAGGAGDGEDGGEEVGGDAEGVVNGGGVEVDVGFEAFAFAHDLCDAFRHFDPFGFAEFLGELDGESAEVGGAWVEDFVNTVADAHDFFLTFEFSFDEGIDVIEFADVLEHVDDAFVGAAVEGAFESSDGGGDGGVHVGECGDGDACGEGGGVHAVVGVKDEGDVEDFGGGIAGDFAVDEVEEVLCFAEVFADGGEFEVVAEAVEGGDDGGGLGADGDGDGGVGGVIRLANGGAFVVDAEHGDGGAEDVHGVGVFWGVF